MNPLNNEAITFKRVFSSNIWIKLDETTKKSGGNYTPFPTIS